MRIKKSYLIIGAILLVAFVVGLVNGDKFKKEQIYLFNDKNVYDTNIPASWDTFKKEHQFPADIKVEEFSMTLNNTGDFESVKFKLVEKKGKKYKIFNYQDCTTCPNLKDGEITVFNETAKKLPSYSSMMSADEFFAKLQEVNQQKLYTEEIINTFFVVRTRQYSQKIEFPGRYFMLENGQVNEIKNSSSPLKGYNLQVLQSSTRDFSSNENTKNIIIGDKQD